MSKQLDCINSSLTEHFGDNLVSLVIFGSSCREKKFKITSDVDYVVIVKELKEPQDKISRILKDKLKNIFPLLAFNIYSKDGFIKILEVNPWLTLTIKLGYRIYFDENDFFKKVIKESFKKLKHQRIGRLAWSVENQKPKKTLLDHYTHQSGRYLRGARLLYKNQLSDIALELLRDSVHCFMIRKLLGKKVFITTGEITQLFFNVFSDEGILKFRPLFLNLEQKSGQKHSFDFDKKGNMLFLSKKSSETRTIFEKCLRAFERLQIFFNERVDGSDAIEFDE